MPDISLGVRLTLGIRKKSRSESKSGQLGQGGGESSRLTGEGENPQRQKPEIENELKKQKKCWGEVLRGGGRKREGVKFLYAVVRKVQEY